MNVELLIADPSGSKAYLPIVEEGIEWTTERRSTPGKLTFKVVKDSIINFQEGAAVRLKVDGKGIFFGFVFSKKRDKDQIITVTAYDQLRYLNNKDTYVYENKTAAQFIKMIAADFSLNVGTIEDTPFVIASRVEDNTSLGMNGLKVLITLNLTFRRKAWFMCPLQHIPSLGMWKQKGR